MVTLLVTGCQGDPAVIEWDFEQGQEAPSLIGGKADRVFVANMPADFPAAQDLAVIFPLRTDDGITGETQTRNGQRLLSKQWVKAVSDSYENTDVGDALERENRYEDWRIVALRFVPCGPLGIRPDQATDELCWPQVRLVWQPVLKDLQVTWMVRDYYPDDRAIHALYHVMPQGSASESTISAIKSHLAEGNSAGSLNSQIRSSFIERRNAAISRLFNGVLALRGAGASGQFNQLDIRAELNTEDVAANSEFTARLRSLLGTLCEPENLFELTSFSLPEGRAPAGVGTWTFVAFDGVEGNLVQKPIEVIGRNSGAVIGHAGFDETVAVGLADPELEEGLDSAEHASELEDSVIFSVEDIDRLQKINDPKQTLVPNTSCASCHSFNPLRFNFHNLSHLEDREVTIAPRVEKDVSADLSWLKTALNR